MHGKDWLAIIIGEQFIRPIAHCPQCDGQFRRSRIWLRPVCWQVLETQRVSQMYFPSLISHVGSKLSCIGVC